MGKNILLFVTGSIAAFKAAALASKLTQEGFQVRVVLSAGAKEFIGASTFEGLTGNRVLMSTFAEGDVMAHIDLARWADLALVYPASANTLAKFAQGQASDLVGTLFLAMNLGGAESTIRKNTVWIAPAMNPTMLAHPATRVNIAKLSEWGCRIVEGVEGRMACGESGPGRLPEPEVMLEEIRNFFSTGTSLNERVVITAGGTSEPVDPVRVLTNISTGETGVRLANAFTNSGARVTLLLSKTSPFASDVSKEVELVGFDSFEDLDRKLAAELRKDTNTLIHAAAVSDYSVEGVETLEGRRISQAQKIHSGEKLRLVLRPNPKILDRVREYSRNPALRVVSFKLSTADAGDVDLSGYSSDFIVHNGVSGIERGSDRHAGEVFAREKSSGPAKYRTIARFQTKTELCSALVSLVKERHHDSRA